VYGKMV